MIIFPKIALNLETCWEFTVLIWVLLPYRYGNGRCPRTIRQRRVIVHFVLLHWVFRFAVFWYFGRFLSNCHRWDDKVQLILFKDRTILFDEHSTNLLGIDHFFIEVFKSRREKEVSEEDSSLDIDAERFTSDLLYIGEKILLFSLFIRGLCCLEIKLVTVLKTIVTSEVRGGFTRYEGIVER